MIIEIAILIVLQIANGFFSMSEAAVIASNRNRLRALAERGDSGAQAALELAQEPTRFLSTVQIFITLIGIVGGAFGGAALSDAIAPLLNGTFLEPYATPIGFAVVVLGTTYLSLVIGELVPKRIALRNPDGIARAVSPMMRTLSRVMGPIVALLSASTAALLQVLRANNVIEAPISEDDVRAMVQEGVQSGSFQAATAEQVEGVLRLSERSAQLLMTPRPEIVYLDLANSDEANRATMREHRFSRYPVVEGGIDHVLGIVHAKDLLARMLESGRLELREAVEPAMFLPETTTAGRMSELFREKNAHIAFVIDEYGGVEGLITIHDLLLQIVGESEADEPVQRADGSWLLDGSLPIDEFKDLLDIHALPGQHERYNTLAGFFMQQFDAVPRVGDRTTWEDYTFEVVDMDGLRIDKLMVSRGAADAPEAAAQPGTVPLSPPVLALTPSPQADAPQPL
jgi:putative hemolysin